MSTESSSRIVVLESTDRFPGATKWSLGIVFLLIVAPIAYAFAHMWFSPLYNKSHYQVQSCVIKSAGMVRSGSKSYSHSEDLYIATQDCGSYRFDGDMNGLSQDQFINKLNAQRGHRLDLRVGNWQLFLSDAVVVGVDF